MQLKLVAVGKLKEKYLQQGFAEYRKRLQAYCRFEVVEVRDESFRENELEYKREEILAKEAESVLREISPTTYLVLLDVYGEMVASEKLAAKMEDLAVHGRSHITFAIGGTLGVAESLRDRADWRLALSPMTFTHQLTRLVLAEQIYRAFTILRNEPYHR